MVTSSIPTEAAKWNSAIILKMYTLLLWMYQNECKKNYSNINSNYFLNYFYIF